MGWLEVAWASKPRNSSPRLGPCAAGLVKELPFDTRIPGFQGCGSGSEFDPDSVTLWIRIRIGNPDPGSGSRGKKIKLKNALLSYLLNKFYH
jgi:hypothetical protein